MAPEESKRTAWTATEAPTQATRRTRRRASPEELREARHVVAAVITAGITLGFIVVVGFGLIDYFTGQHPEDESYGDQLATEWEGILPPCGAGDTCGIASAECLCEEPMACKEHSCVQPPSPPPICTDPEVAKLLKEISAKCKGDIDKCPEDELEKFALASDTFDATLARFESTITIHFDGMTPPLKNTQAWFESSKGHYLKRLDTKRNRELLDEAKVILLVSRSSADRSSSKTTNYTYSRERGRFVRFLLKELAGDSVDAQSRLGRKVKSLALGSQKLIDPKDFRKRLGNQTITWSKSIDQTYGNTLKDYETLRRRKDRKWVDDITNQVTYIIPINCELSEADE